jgi:hypothetical protein
MSVEEPGVIDIIASEEEGSDVMLIVTDHLGWGDREHLMKLQDKLNSYLAFIESGEIFEKYPKAKAKKIKLDVVCKFCPDEEGKKFFQLCREAIAKAGYEFSYRTSGI